MEEQLLLNNKQRRIFDAIVFGILFFISLYFLYQFSLIPTHYGQETITDKIQPVLFFVSPFLGAVFVLSLANLLPGVGYLKLTQTYIEWKGIYQQGKYKWQDIDDIYINKFGILLISLKSGFQTDNQFTKYNRGNIYGINVTNLMKIFGGGKINVNPPGTYGLPKKKLVEVLNEWKNKYGK